MDRRFDILSIQMVRYDDQGEVETEKQLFGKNSLTIEQLIDTLSLKSSKINDSDLSGNRIFYALDDFFVHIYFMDKNQAEDASELLEETGF